MSISELTDYFLRYGAFFIYLIVLLEYLNLPGFPAGVLLCRWREYGRRKVK